ncbi:MAG: LLM class flavin-dependent oxidoreductase [Acidobacteria bacterium]|nr:LLM class flavin-dependent oxidoreductase [Acidobacteriota bacterium]
MDLQIGVASDRDQISQTSIEIFATCPQSSQVAKEAYINNVIDVARWSEKYGCKGILVYTDNSLVDAWLVSQLVIQSTTALCPLVAVQPAYMHPYTVAKMVASYGHLYNRKIYLNMVAGGFKNDLNALNDLTPHDKRYDRMIEYVTIIKQLLAGSAAASFEGEFYKVDKLKMTPPLSPELFPGIFVSGSSDAGLLAARAMGATAVKYPKPPGEYESESLEESIDSGVRVGIIARDDEDVAWRIAHERFPEDRKGELTHQLAMKVSDSVWHKQLSDLGKTSENNPYWLVPFQHYKTFCPYLVGSYSNVAAEIARYITLGFYTFIVDIPPTEEELYHTGIVFKHAVEQVDVKGVAS